MLLNKQGVWEVVYTAKEYQKYQYVITTNKEETLIKIDPYSFLLDGEYSVIYNYKQLKLHQPKIEMKNQSYNHPLNIYEVFLNGWSNQYKTYRDIAKPLVEHLRAYNYNAVQFMPITEYKTDNSWGYQPVGFFAPTHRYGGPEDLTYLIDYLHQNNIYVFLDWTPAHFDNCSYGLKNYDGNKMYEFPYSQYEEHPIWKTMLFDWGNPYVSSFLISSANFWLSIYGFDGLRVDTVTTLIQLFELNEKYEVTSVYYNQDGYQFCRALNDFIKAAHPNAILIAEETQGFCDITNPDVFNFSYKQGLGWSWDTGTFINAKPEENEKQNCLLKPLEYAYTNKSILTYGHDQISKANGFMFHQFHYSYDALRVFYTYMMTFPGKKCLFMGNEYGQGGYWDYDRAIKGVVNDDQKHYSWFVQELNKIYLNTPELYEWDYQPEGMQVVENNCGGRVMAYIRHCSTGSVMCVFNFGNTHYNDYGIDNCNYYKEIKEIFGSVYKHDSQPKIYNNQLHFNLPPHSAFIYRVKN